MVSHLIYILFSVLAGLIFIVLGIRQCRSKTPVVLFSGEISIEPEQLSDVKAWNTRHGTSLIIFGVIITLTCILFLWLVNYLKASIATNIFIIVTVIEFIFLIANHESLERKYKVK